MQTLCESAQKTYPSATVADGYLNAPDEGMDRLCVNKEIAFASECASAI